MKSLFERQSLAAIAAVTTLILVVGVAAWFLFRADQAGEQPASTDVTVSPVTDDSVPLRFSRAPALLEDQPLSAEEVNLLLNVWMQADPELYHFYVQNGTDGSIKLKNLSARMRLVK